jgi:hypothetical protein
MTRRMAGALTLIAILAIAGCTAASPSPSSSAPSASASVAPSSSPSEAVSASPSAAASAPASVAPSEPTESLPAFACTPTVAIPATAGRAQIIDVRVGEHDGYDRVVFEFSGGIPQTLIEAVLEPFYQDASGLPLTVNGTAFLKVTMHNASRVSPDGVVTYTGPTEFDPDLPQVVHLIEGGDFEAVSTWYLGLNGGGCIRVLTLPTPSRLVIDIEH